MFSAIFGPGVVAVLISLFGGYIYDLVILPIDVWLGGDVITGWGIFAALFGI
jgi:hypothetical protein